MRQLNYSASIPGSVLNLVGVGPQPQLVGYTHTNAGYQSVIVQGNYAYVASTGGNGTGIIGLSLTIFNVSNPANPYYVGYLTTGTVVWTIGPSFLNGNYQLAINGNYLYVASSGSSKLYIVNISDPTNPTNVSGLLIANSPGSLYGIATAGNYVYLATQNKGLTVVDVTNPALPVQVYQEGGTLNKTIGVFVANGYAYTTNFQTTAPWTVRYLKIWNVVTPTAPVLLETYTMPAGTKPAYVLVYGNTAYVADLNTNRIYIVDVTTPTAPVYLGQMQASANFNVTNMVSVDGNYAYLTSGANATYGGAIDYFDITNKSAPVLISTTQEGVPTSLFTGNFLYNNLLYVADYGVSPSYASSLKIYSTQHSFSSPINTSNIFCASAQVVGLASGVSGTYTMQGSNDIAGCDGVPGAPVNWDDVTPYTSLSGTTPTMVLDQLTSYQYIRLSYNNTGTGNVSLTLKGLGD